MWNWFKAKPPEKRYSWSINVDGFGVHRVKFHPQDVHAFGIAENLYFKGKEFANIIQAENAIAEYEIFREKSKRKTVKQI